MATRTVIVAPTESKELKAIGTSVSLLPERYGADVLMLIGKYKIGIQRKEVGDLLKSVADGRLVKEVAQMQSLDYKILIVEGKVEWTNNGKLIYKDNYGQEWTRGQYEGLLWSVQDRGIWLHTTDSLQDTIVTVQRMERWFSKSNHTSLSTRPGLAKGMWGDSISHREFAEWLLCSIPGVGPVVAGKIFDLYGCPLKLTVGVEDLMKVEGIGRVKAEAIVRVFQDGN